MSEFPLYRKSEIKMDFPMSKLLRTTIEEADKFYEADDWFWYDMKVRKIETTSKQELLSGFITQEMFNRIWERYGIW